MLFAGEEVGIDVQIHKKVNSNGFLKECAGRICNGNLDADDMEKAFFAQWDFEERHISNGPERNCPGI